MFFYPNRLRVQLDCGDEMITKQSCRDECDIHKILNQYKKTGILTHINSRQAIFADLPDAMDYQQSIEVVREAGEAFAELPATIRERFNNDPFAFLQAIGDPRRRSELEDIGVFNKKTPSEPSSSSSPSPSPSAPNPPASGSA